jgi:hypothetical protein
MAITNRQPKDSMHIFQCMAVGMPTGTVHAFCITAPTTTDKPSRFLFDNTCDVRNGFGSRGAP